MCSQSIQTKCSENLKREHAVRRYRSKRNLSVKLRWIKQAIYTVSLAAGVNSIASFIPVSIKPIIARTLDFIMM